MPLPVVERKPQLKAQLKEQRPKIQLKEQMHKLHRLMPTPKWWYQELMHQDRMLKEQMHKVQEELK